MIAKQRKELHDLLEEDMVVRREYLGLHTQLVPFPQHCSCQRMMMFASHSVQSMVLNGSEPARIFTGMENVVGKYDFSTTRRDQDIQIVGIVPKFNPARWKHGDDMPMHTIVYTGLKDGKLNYMDVYGYTFLHDGFGYINNIVGLDKLSYGNVIGKDDVISRSPSWKGKNYCMGINANVAYMTDWAVTEDAFVISESLARKCTNLEIKQVKLNLSQDDVLLNLYGDAAIDEYKCIPDIGECVRDDGILAAIRTKNPTSYVADMPMEALQKVEHLHDELHKAHPGSRVLDIDIYINFDMLKHLKNSDTIYNQLMRIYEDHLYYYNEIIRYYEEAKAREQPISEEFQNLVLRCMQFSNNRKYVTKRIKLCDPREPIEFITLAITYCHDREISIGSKLTDRCGGKGVISEIRPDDCMPVDKDGFRADIIMTPASVVNRMNPAQLYEQYWNRLSDQVVRNVKAANMPWRQAYEYLLGFCADFRKNYSIAIDKYLCDTEEKKKAWTQACLDRGYVRLLAAWTKGRPYEFFDGLAKKYGVEPSTVSYKVKDEVTGEFRTVETKVPVMIGSKYLMYLGKIPDETITSVEGGFVSQFETPIKPKSKRVKEQSLVGQTPQKFGEDEVCMLNMSLGAPTVARMMCLHSSAPMVVKDLFKTLLTMDRPTQLQALPVKTQDVINQNKNVQLFVHMMGGVGCDVRPNVKS